MIDIPIGSELSTVPILTCITEFLV